MATYVNYYTIAFENAQGRPTSRDVMSFFKRIEELANRDISKINRIINGKQYRISSYFWPDIGEQYVIIPLGKVKNGAPYVETADRKDLQELSQRVYDVNILAYDAIYKTMLITNHQSAPNIWEVENYFNSYLDPEDPIRIRIRPIKYNAGIEKLRNAEKVRSVVFDLNLTAGMANLFQEQVDYNETLSGYFKNIVYGAKESIMGNSMKLEIGLGHVKRNVTLDKESLLDLISTLNIDSSIINEIVVRYYSGGQTKIDKARLKKTEMILSHQFALQGNKIGAEYLKQHLEEAYSEEYGKFSPQIREYFSNRETSDEAYGFVPDWRGDVVAN